MHDKNHTPFASALVVSPHAAHLRIDRDFLKNAGLPKVYADTDIKSALEWLLDNPVALVLLDADLGRTSGTAVTAMLRRRRAFDRTPIVLTSLNGDEQDVLQAVAAGCSGFLLRPYSMESFLRQMRLAARGANPGAARLAALALGNREAAQGRHEAARNAFQAAVAPENDARLRYEAGCGHLAARRFDDAIREFSKALAVNNLYAEAYVGLASAWKELGDPERARENMRLAAQAFALRDEMQRTRRDVAAILRDNPGTENPFVDLGFKLVRQGDFDAAGRAYALAARYSPPGEVHAAMARACHFTSAPEHVARLVAEALAKATGADNGPAVYKAVMGDIPRRTARADARGRVADEPNLMRDVWAVLKYTYKIYRNGGPLPGGSPIALDF